MKTIQDIVFVILLIVVAIVAVIGYLLPTIIAVVRKHHYKWVIFGINLIFGATGMGYLAAFIWAVWPRQTTLKDPAVNDLTTNESISE